MEEEGVIKGYSAVIDKEKVGLSCNARTFAKVDPKHVDACIKALQKIESIYQINQMSGDHNVEFSVAATDYEHLKSIFKEHVSPLGINDLIINIILNSVKEKGPIQIP
jgi:DNA-binding Lrp family transcriptional regulator